MNPYLIFALGQATGIAVFFLLLFLMHNWGKAADYLGAWASRPSRLGKRIKALEGWNEELEGRIYHLEHERKQ